MGSDYSSLNDLVFTHYAAFKDKIAFEVLGKRAAKLTFSEFAMHIKAVKTLFERILPKKNNIALIGSNSYNWIITAIGIICSGHCVVPVDAELTDEEILAQIRFADCRIVVCTDDLLSLFDKDITALSLNKLVECAFNNELPDIGTYEDPPCPEQDKDAAMIVFTSGTTSMPKGVMLSEKNIIAVIKGSNEYLRPVGKVFCFLPLYHTYSFTCGILGTLATGEQIILNDTMRNFSKNLKNSKPSMIFAVPLILEKIRSAIIQNADDSGKLASMKLMMKVSRFLLKLRIDIRKKLFGRILQEFGGELNTVICGGAPLAAETIAFFYDIGITVLNGYGITECAPLVAVVTNKKRSKAEFGSVGQPIYTCRVRIDHDNKNNDGEILVKGDNVMMGYYKNPEATKRILINKWLHTGDIGCIDKYGCLCVKGRIKNMILLGNGKNIYPEELEDILSQIKSVDEVMVYLSENERITAEVYCEAGKAVHEKIKEQIFEANDRLPMYAQINDIIFREEPFEKTTSQKIKRR